MKPQVISILNGSTFVTSDGIGNIEPDPSATQVKGLFFRDMRHLSRWALRINGKVPSPLSADTVSYFFSQFFLTLPLESIYNNPYVSLIRKRVVTDGFEEVLKILNHGREAVELTLEIDADCDFADLFEVKDALQKKGTVSRSFEGETLILTYQREGFTRRTRIVPSDKAEKTEKGFRFIARVEAKAEWEVRIEVQPEVEGGFQSSRQIREGAVSFVKSAPWIDSEPSLVERLYQKSLVDLAALRFFPDPKLLEAIPSAGLPWFMAMFGRDSIITSYQALPFLPDLARTSLRTLASMQGKKVDLFKDEEPGKILHELRFGELTVFGERPQSPYYGSADVTPLFLVLLDEYERWTGDVTLVKSLEQTARAALEWIDRYGDRDGDGYVEYIRGRESGLDNQCWKDSWNSILFADGTVAPSPRATCEIQGYVFDAKKRCARLAREIWGDPEWAAQLEEQANALKVRFNRDFWLPERRFFAVALDGQKRKVDSLTSNVGHLLWSGIIEPDKVEPVVSQLMSPSFFSGWGIRTMAEGEGGFNPIEYHNGTVWPHDNSLIAMGLFASGYREEAARIVSAMMEAAYYFNLRLPEVFAGYSKELTEFPVEYPTASSPQAWATGAPLLGIRILLGLQPVGNELVAEPRLPNWLRNLSLKGIPGRWGKKDLSANNPQAKKRSETIFELIEKRGGGFPKRAA